MKVIVVSGYSNSGKTSVAELLLNSWKKMGLKTASIKNVHTPKFQMDIPNSDSWRHAKAGSEVVGIRSGKGNVLFLYNEVSLDEQIKLIQQVSGCDIILLEGFRDQVKYPQILCIKDREDIVVQWNDKIIAISGIASEQEEFYKGRPMINNFICSDKLIKFVNDYFKLND
ncbi:MAG: molybdopterin-guanine dinucleotide biosynthesis protein B [Candidatus Kariarchaeaceae archaeon]